jgi:hypothetical protein
MNIFTLNFTYILLNISVISFFSLFVLYCKNWNKHGKAYKALVVYLGFLTILQVANRLFFDFIKINWIIANIFLIGEFIISCYLYFLLLQKKIFRNIIIILFFLTLVVMLFQYIADYTIFCKINPLASSIVSISIILFAVFYLYEILDQNKLYYYLTIAVILYQFGSIFLYLIANLYLLEHPDLGLIPYNFHLFLTLIYTFFVFLEWKINFSK